MRDLMAVLKALADESRVRILLALRGGELCVCQIVEFLDLAPSTVSKHIAILKQARLIDGRKEGRWIFYRLADADAPAAAGEISALVRRLAAQEPAGRSDAKRLLQIRKIDPEELCQRYHPC